MSEGNESQLIRTSGLTHIEVDRRIGYYYCNEGELQSLKSTGFIQNITLSFGVGAIFFGVPLLIGIASIQLDGKANPSATVMVGLLAIFVAAIFLWITYLLNEQGKGLLENLKEGGSHSKPGA